MGDAVRVHALQLADRWLDKDPAVMTKVQGMTDDPDARVESSWRLTLQAKSRQTQALDALVSLAARHGDEIFMSPAISSSIVQAPAPFLARLLTANGPTAGTQALYGPVAETIGAQRDELAVGHFLQQTAALSGPDAANQQHAPSWRDWFAGSVAGNPPRSNRATSRADWNGSWPALRPRFPKRRCASPACCN